MPLGKALGGIFSSWFGRQTTPKRMGVPRNMKGGGGGGRNMKLFVFRSKSSEDQKKKKSQHVRRCSLFRAKSSEEQKKGHHALRLTFIRISPLQHESFTHLSAAVAYAGGGFGG